MRVLCTSYRSVVLGVFNVRVYIEEVLARKPHHCVRFQEADRAHSRSFIDIYDSCIIILAKSF